MNPEVVKKGIEWGLLKQLNGKSFCFTGTASIKRDDLVQLITQLDGNVQSSVTKTTAYLICPNETFRKGSKYNAALSHGVPVISEDEFCALILPSLDELLGVQ